MKAAIIGGSGFVGGHLSSYLNNSLCCETILTSSREKDERFIPLNVLDKGSIEKFLITHCPDLIFYLAAQSSVKIAWSEPIKTSDINVFGVLNFLEVSCNLGLKRRTLIVGSGEEYGPSINNAPLKESDLLKPGNVYAVTKACQNMISSVYAKAYSFPLVMTRTFNHFGPGQSPNFVVADFCKQIAMIEKGLCKPEIFVGNLRAKRDFCAVQDVVDAYCRLILFGKPGETYNVGSGRSIEIKEILDTLLGLSRLRIKVVQDPDKYRPLDVEEIVPDISKLQFTTGWSPKISLKKGLLETLNYWREQFK